MPLITVPLSLLEQTMGIPALQFSQPSAMYPKDGTSLTQLISLNHANPMVRQALMDLAIPFDYQVRKGDATFHFRFTDGGIPWQKKLENEEVDIPLSYLMPLADKPEELAAFIKNHQKAIAIPSWENQELYRKKYLTRKLINPGGG